MNNDQHSMIYEASRLLRMALNARETAARNSEYQLLLQRYHTDADFRTTTSSIAGGLNLQVIELARDLGIAVVNIHEGPYAPTLNDFRSNMKARDRITYGLLMAMLAAYVYPNRRAIGEIDDNSVVSIQLRDLVEWCSNTSRQMRSSAEASDVASDDMRSGFEAIAILEPFGEGQATLHYRMRVVLEWLAGHGLFLRKEEGGRELWVARPHYRVQARFLMTSSHDRLIEFLRSKTAPSETSVA